MRFELQPIEYSPNQLTNFGMGLFVADRDRFFLLQ